MNIRIDGQPLKGKRVIVADRHPHARAALREMVAALGPASVSHVQSAAEVLRHVKSREVDVILCDYHLEDFRDGQQLLEELRHERLIAPATIFMMITGERNYRKVVSVAEFVPDDYLLKPFTASQLLERLVRASRKKEIFARAFAFIESGRLEAALPECRAVASGYPEYAGDAHRMIIDLLLGMRRFAEAGDLINDILERKAVPWAHMALANIHFAEGRLGDAERLLEKLVDRHPEYLGAQDFLARVKGELDQPVEALKLLEAAGAVSSENIGRLRHTAELATAIGDHEKSARFYGRVIERARYSAMSRPEDYVALSGAFAEQGKHAEAERVCLEQHTLMRGLPEADLVSRLMDHRRFSRQTDDGASNRAAEAVKAALSARQKLEGTLSVALEFDLFVACMATGHDAPGLDFGRSLLARTDLPAKLRSRLEAALAGRSAPAVRASAIVTLDQVLAMLGKLSAQGWDDALGAACGASITHWAKQDPQAAKLQLAHDRMNEVQRKFGIDTTATERVGG